MLLSISRSAQRYIPKQREEEALRDDIINLASKYGHYGYRSDLNPKMMSRD